MRRLMPLAAWLVSSTVTPWPPSPPDRRVVDTVVAGDEVTDVVNRNINYTNVCTYK